MGLMAIDCPSCHARLRVPDQYINKRARCKGCGKAFIIKAPSLDDTVAEWLTEGSDHIDTNDSGGTVGVPPPPKPSAAVARPAPPPPPAPRPVPVEPSERVVQRNAPAAPKAPPPAPPQPAPPVPTEQELLGEPEAVPQTNGAAKALAPRMALGPSFGPKDGLRLSHVDVLGAFFVFPSMMLENPTFRASLPRCCLGCGVTQSLTAHLVMWSSKLAGHDPSVLTQHEIVTSVRAEVLHRLSADKLLAALPHVPNLPHPYQLPMPYFICTRCTPAGAIMTFVRPMREEGWEQCELGIASLKRAMEFVAHNLGREHEDYARLEQALREHKADAWRALPLPVRNRIESWYKAAPGERFLCYIRDSDFAQAESGMGGLVMTDRRIVFRKAKNQRELWMTDRLEIVADEEGGHYVLRIGRPGGNPAVLHCEPTAAELIRHNLKMMGANYTFRI